MALWGVEVKPGEAYVHDSHSHGRLRITQFNFVTDEIEKILKATLGHLDNLGWSMLEGGSADEERLARLCALHPTNSPMCHLNLELEEDHSVVFSVRGNSSIHLSGYYILSKPTGAAAAPTNSKKNHQNISEKNSKKPRREDAPLISDKTAHVHNNSRDDKSRHGSDHESNNQRNSKKPTREDAPLISDKTAHVHNNSRDDKSCHGSDHESNNQGDDDLVEIDAMPPPSRNKKEVVEKPSGSIAATGTGLKDQVSDTDDKNETTSKPEADDELAMRDIIKGNSDAEIASNGSKVTVEYVGWLKNGKMIHRCSDYTFKLGAKKLIAGWELGILGMRVGGKRRLTIPPSLGYGDKKQRRIPGNSWLVYDIVLKKVE